jgi:hypothetical protein
MGWFIATNTSKRNGEYVSHAPKKDQTLCFPTGKGAEAAGSAMVRAEARSSLSALEDGASALEHCWDEHLKTSHIVTIRMVIVGNC